MRCRCVTMAAAGLTEVLDTIAAARLTAADRRRLLQRAVRVAVLGRAAEVQSGGCGEASVEVVPEKGVLERVQHLTGLVGRVRGQECTDGQAVHFLKGLGPQGQEVGKRFAKLSRVRNSLVHRGAMLLADVVTAAVGGR